MIFLLRCSTAAGLWYKAPALLARGEFGLLVTFFVNHDNVERIRRAQRRLIWTRGELHYMRGSLGRRMIVVVGGVMALMLACVAGRIWFYT